MNPNDARSRSFLGYFVMKKTKDDPKPIPVSGRFSMPESAKQYAELCERQAKAAGEEAEFVVESKTITHRGRRPRIFP